jgi:hypothetical protein
MSVEYPPAAALNNATDRAFTVAIFQFSFLLRFVKLDFFAKKPSASREKKPALA